MGDRVRREAERPIWLWVVVGLIVFAPLMEGGTTHTAVMVIRLLILLLGGLYLRRGLSRGAFACPPVTVGLPVLAYLGLALVSTITSPYTDQSLQWLLVLSSYAGFLALLVFFVDRWDHAAKLLTVFIVMAVGEGAWALAQAWWWSTLRPSGTFFNPNFLAVYLAAAWAIVLAYLCYAGGGKVPRPATWRRADPPRTRRGASLALRAWALPVGILGLLLLAIVWTGSRGGLLALVVGTTAVVTLRFGRRSVALMALLLMVLLLVPNPLRDRLWAEHRANPETYARWQMWGQSALGMADHPLGIGLGLYQYWAPAYMFPIEGQIVRYGKIANSAHNEYLQMGVELGVASLPVFGWGLWLVAREAGRALNERMHRWQRGLVVGLIAAVMTLLAQAAVDSTFHEPALALLLTLCVGLLLSARRFGMRQPPPVPNLVITSRPIWAALGLAGLLLVTAEIVRLGLAWQAYESGAQAAARRDLPQALASYRAAVALDPGKALYHSLLASGHFQLFERTREPGAAQAAVQELQVALSLNPLDGRLAALLGHVAASVVNSGIPEVSSAGRRAALLMVARAAYERAVELEPFVPFYRLELGKLALALGERTVAESWVRGAVEMEPNFLPGREWLTRLYLASSRMEAANREVLEIRERQQRYTAWSKDALEARFLRADAAALEAALASAVPPA